MVPAFEIMSVTPAIRNMIRDNKVHQIDGLIATSAKDDMIRHGYESDEPL